MHEAALRVLRLPAVADKTFLIAIGDRTVGGMTARDQMVGPWQVPVADVAVTLAGFHEYRGEAMAMGERTPLALIDPAASGRMAVGEAITNIAAAPIAAIGDIKLSANWMAAAGHPGEDAALYDTVRAVGMELCPQLGISIPVGKDSLSMKTTWSDGGTEKAVTAPLSLIVSAFAPVTDARKTLTPQLKLDSGDTALVLIDLGAGKNRLGGSALAQVYGQVGSAAPDLDAPRQLVQCFDTVQKLNREGRILAYHDRSDGGLFVTLCEMAFASRAGLAIKLLAERRARRAVQRRARRRPAGACRRSAARARRVRRGRPAGGIRRDRQAGRRRYHQHRMWRRGNLPRVPHGAAPQPGRQPRFSCNSLRDHPACAREEYDRILDVADPGICATAQVRSRRRRRRDR